MLLSTIDFPQMFMKKRYMKKSHFIFFAVLIMIMSCSKADRNHFIENNIFKKKEKPVVDSEKTTKKANEAFIFCKKEKYNTDFCILVDMSLHSGVKRLFLWDFNEKKIAARYLVGHGCGNSFWSMDFTKDEPKFSNTDGSHLSSLGKYRLGERGYSEWGIHVKYLMHGLENTNNNALKRTIVFHSWDKMKDEEVFPKGSPEGWGCPTVSNNALKEIDEKLKKSKKPVLFWIYN